MIPNKAGRPSKGQLTCFACKTSCQPKNGDWFVSAASRDQQVFLCRNCERQTQREYKRAVPIR